MSGSTREATAYLQLEPGAPSAYGKSGWQLRDCATVVRCTNSKPAEPIPGCIVVKVKIRVPREAWEPLSPEAIIEVPAELVQRPVTVSAVGVND